MTTLIPFVQPPTSPFQTQVTLDNQPYTMTVTWLYWGQRYYVSLVSLDNTLIFNQALIGSPNGLPLETLSWANGTVTATTNADHGYHIGDTVSLTISACAPVAYNGVVLALITNANTFTYPLAMPPGVVSQLGGVSFDINIAGGYFTDSTLVYRDTNAVFEVNP